MKTARIKPPELSKRPYMRTVIPQEDGTYFAEILEFPGCIATGETPQEALAVLEEVAESWIQSSLNSGRAIPEPYNEIDYSGKTMLRMPKSLHRKAALAAGMDGVSLNLFIVNAVAASLGQRNALPAPPKETKYNILNVQVLNAPVAMDTMGSTPIKLPSVMRTLQHA